MKQRVHLRKAILDLRLKESLPEYLERCTEMVSGINKTRILDGMGKLLDPDLKKWVKGSLKEEFISLARMYCEMPLIE